MVGVERPTPELAEQARRVLGRPDPPESLIVAVPPSVLGSLALDQAASEAGLALAKLVSKELVKPIGGHAEVAVDIFWVGVKLYRLSERWARPDRDLPTLVLDTATTALDVAAIGSDLAGIGEHIWTDDDLMDSVGAVFTASGAALDGDDVSLALIEDRFISSDPLGKLVPVVSPLIKAALSDRPEYRSIGLQPLDEL
jgi:hypothetical protein